MFIHTHFFALSRLLLGLLQQQGDRPLLAALGIQQLKVAPADDLLMTYCPTPSSQLSNLSRNINGGPMWAMPRFHLPCNFQSILDTEVANFGPQGLAHKCPAGTSYMHSNRKSVRV